MKLATPSLTNNATKPQLEAPERNENLRAKHVGDPDCLRVPQNSHASLSSCLKGPDDDGGGDDDLPQTYHIIDWVNKVEEYLPKSEQGQAASSNGVEEQVSLNGGGSDGTENCPCVRENDKFLTLAINLIASYQALSQDPEILKSFGQRFKNNELCVVIEHIFGLLEGREVSPGQVFRDFQASKPTMLTSEGLMLHPSRLDIKQLGNKPMQLPPLPPLPPDQKWDLLISAGVFLGKLGLYAVQDESPIEVIYKAAAACSNIDKTMGSYNITTHNGPRDKHSWHT
ncbi:hypothetical protein FVEG_06990 [Fusarium verticillioides 7600]|uniref:Uncharacterized protein n=1 Tax=Gibberella moniliformis (strain M3125 / FGSC 7600) TaxID=334819 RepID=W7M697_GIBM7|nr:hypothetical protein FVEG_06990 [Fusarium verticillioides 7600]EWG46541.1 hypothetical protein FVEG_06990 [Fusarium verticillioides 7600]